MVSIRKARIDDAEGIKRIIDVYANEGIMLPRSIYEIYENIRDYSVAEREGKIVGCSSVHVFGKEYKPNSEESASILGEIKSLAVVKDYQSNRIGRELVEKSIEEAKELGVTKVFSLVHEGALGFFNHMGFERIEKSELPQKIWSECYRCPKFPEKCDETGVVFDIEIS